MQFDMESEFTKNQYRLLYEFCINSYKNVKNTGIKERVIVCMKKLSNDMGVEFELLNTEDLVYFLESADASNTFLSFCFFVVIFTVKQNVHSHVSHCLMQVATL